MSRPHIQSGWIVRFTLKRTLSNLPPRTMTASEIRNSFLDFFTEKQHTIVPSASLLPQSPGLLFTNAGMNPFVPYFLGVEKAPYNPRVRPTPKNASVRAENTTTSKMLATTLITTRFSKCSETGRSETISKRSHPMGMGIGRRALGTSCAPALRIGLRAETWRSRKFRSRSLRHLGGTFPRGRLRSGNPNRSR